MYKVISTEDSNFQKQISELKKLDSKFEPLDNKLYFVVEDVEGILAYACIDHLDDTYSLEKIFVRAELRYHSFGTKLLNFIVSTGMRNHVKKLVVKKFQDDEKLFFIKSGFVQTRDGLFIYDNIQKQKQRTREGLKGTLISIAINVLLSIFKVSIGIFGRSQALIADGFHSISDVVGSIVVFFCIHLGGAPEDDDHPYGHEKIESIAGNIIGTLLIITAFELIKSNIIDLLNRVSHEKPSKITIVVAFLSIIIKYSLYLYKENLGEQTNNDAIKADAREHRSDSMSSLGVMIGIVLAIYINPLFDTLLSILVSLFIGKEGINIIFETSNTLLDKQDKEFISDIEVYVRNNSNVGNIHDTLMRVSGDKVFLSFHIRLPKDMTVYDAHCLADELKYSLLEDFRTLRDVTIHIDYIH